MKTDKKTKVLVCILLSMLLTVFSAGIFVAANTDKTAEVYASGDRWESKYLNRLHLSLDATGFVFMKEDTDNYVFRFTMTAEKTEPDFYAAFDSFNVIGIPYESLTVTAAEENGAILMIPGAELPTTKQEKTAPLAWTVEIRFKAPQAVTYTPTVQVGYTSGTSYALRESYRIDIPLTVKITDLGTLPTVLSDAEKLFTMDIYTQESLDVLREKMDDIYYALRSPQDITAEQIILWQQELENCIASLKPL